ncbi:MULTISPECIES: hypothetical protein [Pacificimonas]|nr:MULTISPECIES: hypothetical protein [Pacificimonas]MBZ6377378.1 hypothetical protein [Pacificimonas aurantium]
MTRTYEVLTPIALETGEPTTPVGTILPLDPTVAAPLLAVAALRPVNVRPVTSDEGSGDRAQSDGEKPLGKQTKEELRATAEAAGIDLAGIEKNRDLVHRIEAVQTARRYFGDDNLEGLADPFLVEALTGLQVEIPDNADKAKLVELVKAKLSAD